MDQDHGDPLGFREFDQGFGEVWFDDRFGPFASAVYGSPTATATSTLPYAKEVSRRILQLNDSGPVLPGPGQSLSSRIPSPLSSKGSKERAPKPRLDSPHELLELLSTRRFGLAHYLL
jgi:hypothetical protein